MKQDQLEKTVAELVGQRLISRDLIAWLLGSIAAREPDPEAVLKSVSEHEDARIDQRKATAQFDLQIAEAMRREKDWIVAAAAKMSRPAGEA